MLLQGLKCLSFSVMDVLLILIHCHSNPLSDESLNVSLYGNPQCLVNT